MSRYKSIHFILNAFLQYLLCSIKAFPMLKIIQQDIRVQENSHLSYFSILAFASSFL